MVYSCFAHCNDMQLNPSKCKLMRVDFLRYNSCYSQPIAVGGSVIESVESFKLLGVYISMDLSWSTHCDYIIGKSNRRLYALKKTESLWGTIWGFGDCALLPTKICPRVCIGSFCKLTAVSLHGGRKSAKESPTNHVWS